VSLSDREIIAMTISEMMLRLYGFGPSHIVCLAFVDQVMAEAAPLGVTLPPQGIGAAE
jgi:hypothetical protein